MQSGAYREGLPNDSLMMVAQSPWVQNAIEVALQQVVQPLGRFDILRDVQASTMVLHADTHLASHTNTGHLLHF